MGGALYYTACGFLFKALFFVCYSQTLLSSNSPVLRINKPVKSKTKVCYECLRCVVLPFFSTFSPPFPPYPELSWRRRHASRRHNWALEFPVKICQEISFIGDPALPLCCAFLKVVLLESCVACGWQLRACLWTFILSVLGLWLLLKGSVSGGAIALCV